MRLTIAFATVALLATTSPMSFAQGPPPKRSGLQGGPGGSGGPRPPSRTGELIFQLLGHPEVRGELAVTREQEAALRERSEVIREEMDVLFKKRVSEAVREVLSAEPFTRLQQITASVLGPEALLDVEVAEKLRLTPRQLADIRALPDAALLEIEAAKHLFKGKEGEELRFMAEDDIRQSARDRILHLVTPEQRRQFIAMTGPGSDASRFQRKPPKPAPPRAEAAANRP